MSSSEHNEHAQARAEQLDEGDGIRGRNIVRVQVLCAVAAAKSVIYSSWLDACSKHQRKFFVSRGRQMGRGATF
jgi:hypothetical protein